MKEVATRQTQTQTVGETKAVRYSQKELDLFRDLINSSLEKTRHRIDEISQSVEVLVENQGPASQEDSDGQDKELLERERIRLRVYEGHLQNALIRIVTKSYGVCHSCKHEYPTGHLIDKDRLRLVPHATKCMQAKKRDDDRKHVR